MEGFFDTAMQLRVYFAGNQRLINLIESSSNNNCIKRVVSLLDGVAADGEKIICAAQKIIEMSTGVPYSGFSPVLTYHEMSMTNAADNMMESSTRILLYLEHISCQGPTAILSRSTRHLLKSAITTQQDLARQIHQKARENLATLRVKPPGPAPLPYADQDYLHKLEPASFRDHRLVDGTPCSVGNHYDIRWDPDYRTPGSQHVKFLTFPGPFFKTGADNGDVFDKFHLPAVLGDLYDKLVFEYDSVEHNFKTTGRLQPPSRGEQVAVDQKKREALTNFLATESGYFYDLDSLSFHEYLRSHDAHPTVGPYVEKNWLLMSSRKRDGTWSHEDKNRILLMLHSGSHCLVRNQTVGRLIYVGKHLSREAENSKQAD